jgi:hypothetical protein
VPSPHRNNHRINSPQNVLQISSCLHKLYCALLPTIFGMIGRGRGEFIWHTAREKKLRNFEQCDFLPLDIWLVYPVCHGSCLGTFTWQASEPKRTATVLHSPFFRSLQRTKLLTLLLCINIFTCHGSVLDDFSLHRTCTAVSFLYII